MFQSLKESFETFCSSLYHPEDTIIENWVDPELLSYLDPYWWKFRPIEPIFYYIFGTLFGFFGLVSIIGNCLVILIFYKYSNLRSPSSFLIINLAFSDLMIMAGLVPELVWNCFKGGQWRFGYVACMIHGFFGAMFGYLQIFTLVCIAYDRYNVIVKGFGRRPMSKTRVKYYLLLLWGYSGFWAVCPLFGFGGYSIDGLIAACSFDYMNRDHINVKYIVGSCIFCYAIPLLCITVFYYYIVKAVWVHEAILKAQAKKMNVVSLRSNFDDGNGKNSAEIKIAKVAMLNITLWIIAWTPFAVTNMIGVIGNQKLLTPLVTGLPILLAKSSCIYNPIIYAISHPKYRECLKKLFCKASSKNQSGKDNQSTATELTKFNESTNNSCNTTKI